MQKLLEETVLFDISLDHHDNSYGDPWVNIQSKMNRLLHKPNSPSIQSPNIKPALSSRNNKKTQQTRRYSKYSPQNSFQDLSPTKILPFEQNSSKKDQNQSKNPFLHNMGVLYQAKYENKNTNFDNHTSLMKLELLLLEKDQKSKSYLKKLNLQDLQQNKITHYDKKFHKSDRYELKKKDDSSKNKLKNDPYKKDFKYIICDKPSFPSRNNLGKNNSRPKAESSHTQPLQEHQTSGGNQVSEKSNKIRSKGSFESLGNVLNVDNNVQITVNIQRRSSIEKKTQRTEPGQMKAIGISFKRQVKDNKSPLCIMGPLSDNKKGNFEGKCDQGSLKSLQQKLCNQPLPLSEIQQESIIAKQEKAMLLSKHFTPFQRDILELKQILKDNQQKKYRLVMQKINLNKEVRLPTLRARSQSFCTQPKKFYRNSKKKYTFLESQKKHANSKLKDSRQQKSKTLSPSKIQEIHLILNKRKNSISIEQTIEEKTLMREKSLFKERAKNEGRNQSILNQPQIIRKVSLSQILNGKFKIDECFNKSESMGKENAKSCFFTNYKNTETLKDKEKEIKSKKNNKEREKVEKEKDKENRETNANSSSEMNSTKEKFICNLSKLVKSKSLDTSVTPSPCEYTQKILRERKVSKLNQLDSIGKIMNKKNELVLLTKHKEGVRESSMEQKTETKWRPNSIEGKSREKSREKRKSQFSLRKNLNAQENISLFKLSLNRNKKKLVIVRK